ncbi:MAG: dephospho-CoA kinase [Gemmatimonadaceae bacterium]
MLLVGLTGNIASGKSTVAALFAGRGATLIDADVLAREAVGPGTPALARIAARWGPAVLEPGGTLNRAALRTTVFADHDQLEELNGIVHPEIDRLRGDRLAASRARGDRVVVCDIPLLFERRMTDEFDRIVLVDAPRSLRLDRLVRDRGLPEAEAMDMIASQMPAELKRARADYIIVNDGSLRALEQRVDEVWDALDRQSSPRTAPARVP